MSEILHFLEALRAANFKFKKKTTWDCSQIVDPPLTQGTFVISLTSTNQYKLTE